MPLGQITKGLLHTNADPNYQPVELAPQFTIPKPQSGLAEPAATDAAALLSIATGTPFDVNRYKQGFMDKGLVTEWRGLEDMWRMSQEGASRGRIEKMIEGKALRHGINLKPVTEEEVSRAIINYATVQDDGMLHEVATRLATEPHHPNADVNELQMKEMITNSLEEYIVGEKRSYAGIKKSIDDALVSRDPTYPSLIGGMFAQVFAPTDVVAAGQLRNAILNEEGELKLSSAQAMQEVRNFYATASPKDKELASQRLVEWVKHNSQYVTDWQIAGLLGQIDNGKLLETGSPEDKLNYGLSVVSDILDYTYILRPLKALVTMGGRALTTAPRTLRLANSVNRRRAASIMRGLLEGAQTNATLKNWGINPEEIIATQLPKPHVGVVESMPGEVAVDAARVKAIREEVSALDAATRAPIFEPEEVIGAAERTAKQLEQTWAPKLRVNLSTVGFTSDRAGVEFGLVLGKDELHGFTRLDEAIAFARQLDDTGNDVSIMRTNPADSSVELYSDGKIIHRTDISGGVAGEFFVKLKHRYSLSPMDKMLFDDDAVLAPTWLGGAMKWVLPPSSIFKPEVANKYISNFMTEAAMQDALGSIVRPLFKELDGAQRAKVGQMMMWTEDFGRNQNRIPTWNELRTQFPEASDKELLGWWRVKEFYDTAYALNNQRLYRDWNSRGYKTAWSPTFPNLRIHGRPMSVQEARAKSHNGFVTVYDPDKNRALAIRNKDVETVLGKRGYSILEVDTPIQSGRGGAYHTMVLVKSPSEGWNLKTLDQNVLRYIPGYYPRIYQDFYYIKRVREGANVDGKIGTHEETVAVASTEKEAQAFIERITAATGDDSVKYVQTSDARLRSRDATAADLDRMRIEGRLFFDERNAQKLYNVNGNPAEIVDPINAINRTARMLSRQMATEDYVKAMKQGWKNTYGDGIKGLNVDTDTSTVVGDKLNELIKTSPKADRERLIKARALWDHIRLIEGSTGEGASWFRGASIRTAEFLHNLRGIGGTQATQGLLRNAHKVAPVEWMKNLAFFDFLVTRPARQLILQGAQHLFIAPLSPSYMGRWQLDTISVLQGLKRNGMAKAGLRDLSEAQSNRNALLMGLKREEYDLLVDKLRQSGIVQTVNVHSYAGDLPRHIETTRYSTAGRVAQGALDLATAKPIRRGLEKYGFELGEQVNVVASYMMALRLYKQANKIDDLTKISPKGWDEIKVQASNYSLAMHRANASSYQYGLLSLPLQFLQFTHKVFLTYMRGIPGAAKLGNKSFTPAQARKILLGQLVMFGGAAFGIRPEVEAWLSQEGFDRVPAPVKDMISGGAIDWMLNEWAQKMLDDEEVRWAFGDWLAPGGNMIHLVREMVQTIAEQPALVALLGPSFVTASRFSEGIMMAKEIWTHDLFEESTPGERALYAIESVSAGLMSGYNDFMKARLAMKMGFWATGSGQQTEIEAKWSQAVVKAGLGLSHQELLDSNGLRREVSEELKNLDEVAQESYNRMYRIVGLYGDSSDRERFLSDVRQEQALLQILEPHELQYVYNKWQRIERDNPEREPLADIIAKAIGKGYQGSELMDRVRSTRALDHDEATRAQLLELLERAQQDIDWTNQEIMESTEKEIEAIKSMTAEEEK